MQQYTDIYLLLNYSTCFGRPSRPLSVHKTVVAASGTDHTAWGARFFKRDQIRQYDLYHRLQLQFYVLLMLGAMDARNMQSNLAINKYLHTVASRQISSTVFLHSFGLGYQPERVKAGICLLFYILLASLVGWYLISLKFFRIFVFIFVMWK